MDFNIFEYEGLIEAIISDLQEIKQKQEKLDQRQESTQKAIAKLRADLIRSGILKIR